MLLPPDLREWVPEDDLVHFVIESVDRLPLKGFRVNNRGTGGQTVSAPHDASPADLELRQRLIFLPKDRTSHPP
jgi:hypothetical protein